MQVLGYDVSPERAWLGAFVAGVLGIVGSAVAFTEQVYWGFIWRYFWGPVFADAEGAQCVAYFRDSSEVAINPAAGCTGLTNAYVAEPGYTTVSTVGYMIILVFMLTGVYYLLQRFTLEPVRKFFYALVPFMLFGGVLRAVEDSFVAAQRAGVEPAIEFPWSAVLISPFIYFTVFGIALAAFLASKGLKAGDLTDTYHYPLGAMGIGTLLLSGGYLAWLSTSTDYVFAYPLVLVTVAVLSVVFAVGIYTAIDRYRPAIHRGTGYMGLVVLWAHAVDGVANVIASDWTGVFGIPGGGYSAKHVVNRIIIDVTQTIQPAWLTEMIGDSWTFLVVKLIVAAAILAVFDEKFLHENPYYAVMLLVAVVAVGLGPGTRDVVRVTLGI
jgi:uncharacterized membrane protein